MRLSIECKSVQRTESVLGLHFPCLQKFELRGLFMSQLLFSPLFLSINSTIENLRIDIAYRVPDHVSFWETLSNLTKLKALEVSMITLTNESVDAFRRILCRLERVKFNLIALPDNIMENVESVSNLKYLSLRNIDFAKPQVPIFVEKSTLLEHLELSKYGNFEPLMGGMRRFHWPNLHSLSLTETMLDSIQLQQIFCSLTRLTELTLSSSTWDIESFNALSRHFATLEILHDLDSITFTSVMINTVLCSCINLKVLAAPEIKGIDIINGNQINGTQLGGEWVCTQLSTFIIQISTEGVDSQIPILEEMSRLTGLKILNTREIMNQIVSYLSKSDFPACISVSKHWHQVFKWIIWKNARFHDFAPSEIALSKNAHLITALSIGGSVPSYISSTVFPSLQTLKLTGQNSNKLQFSPYFLKINQTLESLTLQYNVMVINHDLFWERLSDNHQLKKINITDITVTPKSIDAFWRTLCRLESAEFRNLRFYDELITPLTTPLSLKHLSIFEPKYPIAQLECAKRCISLESLDFGVGYNCLTLVECFETITWPNLTKLGLDYVALDDMQLQRILSSFNKLTAFSVKCSIWGRGSFDALSRHFDTLEILRAVDPSFTSTMINIVMCSCSRLEVLEVQKINGVDIISNVWMNNYGSSGTGWICTQLKSLTTRFDIDGLDSQETILQQLSFLTQLSILDMRQLSNESFPGLNFSLDDGLDILKTLKDLELVTIMGDRNNMTEAEIEWILENWRKLRCINGTLHRESEKRAQLRQKLRSYRIDSSFIISL
ncbi:hypothetical protein BGZ76_005291 [Entomortierella beljakovae]|nr:hypothetical protein BGZ76_005291 [Entomortierella beljakovae]